MGAKLGGNKGGVSQNSEINVTPFVDIMLVLLIGFMVAAPMATVSIKLDLPPAVPSASDDKPKEPVYVSIQDGGDLYIADQKTSLATLAADVCAAQGAVANCREERVFVRAQADVKYNQFMEVMNTLQENGMFKVGLLNEDIE